MKYNKIINTIFILFFVTKSFGQENIDNKKIKIIEEHWFNKNESLDRIIYEKYNLDGEVTEFIMQEGDSTQIMRRSYKYNEKGLLKLEEHYRYAPKITTSPEYQIEVIYDENDHIIQKRTFSNYKTREIYDDKGYLSQVITDLNSGKITNRELYIYDNDLLIEVRFLNENNKVYGNKILKYNKLNQKIEEISIRNNQTQSKYKYEYNDKGQVIKEISFIKKKEKVTENLQQTEGYDIVEIDDTEQTNPEKWQDWEEEEIYEIETYVYNEFDLIVLNKTEGDTEFKDVIKRVFEYDTHNNWIKCTTQRYGGLWRTSIRKIEYY